MAARKLIDLSLLGEVTNGFKSYVDTVVETAVSNGTTDLISKVEIIEGILVVTKKNGETQQYTITPCTVCAATNTASVDDIAAMLKESDIATTDSTEYTSGTMSISADGEETT